jgi:hypothetical protein
MAAMASKHDGSVESTQASAPHQRYDAAMVHGAFLVCIAVLVVSWFALLE